MSAVRLCDARAADVGDVAQELLTLEQSQSAVRIRSEGACIRMKITRRDEVAGQGFAMIEDAVEALDLFVAHPVVRCIPLDLNPGDGLLGAWRRIQLEIHTGPVGEMLLSNHLDCVPGRAKDMGDKLLEV